MPVWQRQEIQAVLFARATVTELTAMITLCLAERAEQMTARRIKKDAPAARSAQEAQRDRLTREAMAEVESGRVVDQIQVMAWAEGLGTEQPLPVPRPL